MKELQEAIQQAIYNVLDGDNEELKGISIHIDVFIDEQGFVDVYVSNQGKMKNEENKKKAMEIAGCCTCKDPFCGVRFSPQSPESFGVCNKFYGAIEMAKWKDKQLKKQRRIIRNHWQEWAEEQKQQLIDKACDWLKNNIMITTQQMFEDFKQEMKGEQNYETH